MRFRDEASEEWAKVGWSCSRCAACAPHEGPSGAASEGAEAGHEADGSLVECELCHFWYCPDCAEPIQHDCVDVAWHFNGQRL